MWPQIWTRVKLQFGLKSGISGLKSGRSGLKFGLKSGLKLKLKKSNLNLNQMGFPEPDSKPI